MKIIFSIIVSGLFFINCATTYSPISKLDSIGDASAKNDELEITVGIQQMGDNSRFKDKLEEKKITFLQLSVTNLSSKPISINKDNIYLRTIPVKSPISQLTPNVTADRMKLTTMGYWFWGLLWFGTYENNNGVVESSWYPVGLVIGAINFFIANSTNSNFENDISKNSFSTGEIKPGQTKKGMVYFNQRSAQKYDFVVAYPDSLGNNKEISLPYKL